MNLSSRQMRAFVALAETRSFTRAAEHTHLSQPAFSALIRTLEDAVGARLFERDTRNVGLTAEGVLFRQWAERLLADFDSIERDLKDRVARRKGRVAIAALPSLAAGWLPGVFAEFRARHPGVDLALTDTLSDRCVELVRSGSVDFAIASTQPNSVELVTEVLCSDAFYVVCRKDHPLARKRALKVQDLAAWPFVHLSRTSSVRQHLEAALHPQHMQTVLEVEHLATVAGMVEGGVGITVVPALTLFHFERANLAMRPIKLEGLKRDIYIVRRRHGGLSIAAQAMVELMLERKPKVANIRNAT